MAPIARIEHFRVPPRWLFVKITDEHGNHGWGEATLEGHTESIEGTLNGFIKRFLGFEADNIEALFQDVFRKSFYRGGPVFMSALAGLDIALHDLKARRLNLPIWQMLGGKVRSRVQVYAWIGGDRPDDVAEAARARKAQGFRAVKMNATEDVGWLDSPSVLKSSVERLKLVKAEGMDAGIDFHGRLHKPMAKQLIKLLEPHEPLFIEEPLLSEHVESIKEIYSTTHCPIALGERLYSRWDFKKFFELACVDIIQPDVAHCGGISEMKKIAAMAEAYDICIAPHCPLGPIALAACLQIGICTPNHQIQEMSLGIHYNTEMGEYDIHSYVKNPEVFKVHEGYVNALEGPGLGIEVDEVLVREVAKTAQHWELKGFTGPDGGLREW